MTTLPPALPRIQNLLFIASLSALLFFLSACSDSTNSTDSTGQTAIEAESPAGTSEAPAPVEAELVSGIDRSNFDESIRPQDDLFSFVNGGWVANTAMPADKSRYGAFGILADQAEEDVRVLVEEVSKAKDVQPGSAAQKIRDYYNAYMDDAATNAKGVSPLSEDLAKIAAAQNHDDIVRLFGSLGMDGVTSPFGGFIFSDFQDANINVVYLSENGLTLPDRDYYLKDDEQFVKGRELLQQYAQTLFELAGLEGADTIGKRILTLESQLAEVQWTREENRDRVKQYNPKTLTELGEMSPGIDWVGFFDASLLPERDRYIVMQPSYFTAAAEIITNTDVAAWQDYLRFQTLSAYAPILSDAFFDASFTMFNKGLQGTEEARPRWKRAIASLNGNLGELLGQLYVEKHFDAKAKARMQELIDNLIEAYRVSISELEWMSDATKQQALEKLSKFNSKIGYPDAWRDYSTLEVIAGDLVGNVKRANAFEYQRQINKLDRPVDKSEWLMTPQTVNAYYLPMWNEIVFPASILQPPYFNMAADDAANYGAIGAIIGHEIGHGFDDSGRRFDGDGNLRDWWTEEDNARFLERKNKLATQFNSYEVIDGMTINGEFTSGENIGDLGGLTIAHRAYQLSLGGQEAPVIEGWTGDQRFFLGWAQAWRQIARPEEVKRLLTVDSHSPASFRANGTVVNVPGFYTAFDVKEGDALYLPPEERVKIW